MRDEHAVFINAFEKLGTDRQTQKPYKSLKLAFCAMESDYCSELCGFTGTIKESEYDKVKGLQFGDEIDIVFNKSQYGTKVELICGVCPMDSKKK